MAKATAGLGKGQSARETEKDKTKEQQRETTGLAYVNTSRKSMCISVHMCVHNHINVRCIAYKDAQGKTQTFSGINKQR